MRYTAVDRDILIGAKNAIRAIVLNMNNRYYGFPGFCACARDLFRLMRTNPQYVNQWYLVHLNSENESYEQPYCTRR